MYAKVRDMWKTAALGLGYATMPASFAAGGCAAIGLIVHYESYLVSTPTAISFVEVAYLVGLRLSGPDSRTPRDPCRLPQYTITYNSK